MTNNISVAMTTYNGERFLNKQIDSILTQTLMPDEIIICDDGSSDGTKNILESYQSMHSDLIKVYYNETNLGYIKNFEKAISLTKGDFIALSDQDDLWVPNRLISLFTEINESLLVYSDSKIINSNDLIVSHNFIADCDKFPTYSFMDLFLRKGIVQGSSILFSRTLYEKAIPFPDIIPHDVWLITIAKNYNRISFSKNTFLYYRMHDKNVIGKKTDKVTIKTYAKEFVYFFKKRSVFYRYLKVKSDFFLNRSFITDIHRNQLTELNNIVTKIICPKKIFQFDILRSLWKYRKALCRVDSELRLIPYLRFFSIWFTPYIYRKGKKD